MEEQRRRLTDEMSIGLEHLLLFAESFDMSLSQKQAYEHGESPEYGKYFAGLGAKAPEDREHFINLLPPLLEAWMDATCKLIARNNHRLLEMMDYLVSGKS